MFAYWVRVKLGQGNGEDPNASDSLVMSKFDNFKCHASDSNRVEVYV
jgi:hypothetical protein